MKFLPELLTYFKGVFDNQRLHAELTVYEQWAARNSAPVLQGTFLHRSPDMNMLVAAIWSCKNWKRSRDENPGLQAPMGAKRLAGIALSLAIVENHAPDWFDDPARELLRQRLQAPAQAWGVIHEVQTAAYFIRYGARVDPLFLRKSSHYDLMTHWGNDKVPVQCKCKEPGAGRAIASETFGLLAGYIARDASDTGRKVLVRIGSTGKIRASDIDAIRERVRNIRGRTLSAELLHCSDRTYSIWVQGIEGRFTPAEAGDFLKSYNFHLQMLVAMPTSDGNGYEPMVAVGIEADPEESPWLSLSRSIEEAIDQLEGGPPSIVAINYVDHIEDFESLRPGPEPMSHTIRKRIHGSPHVAMVMLSSEPDLQLPGSGEPGAVKLYGRWKLLPPRLNSAFPS